MGGDCATTSLSLSFSLSSPTLPSPDDMGSLHKWEMSCGAVLGHSAMQKCFSSSGVLDIRDLGSALLLGLPPWPESYCLNIETRTQSNAYPQHLMLWPLPMKHNLLGNIIDQQLKQEWALEKVE